MNLLDEHNTIFSVYLVFNFFLSRSFYLCVLLMIFNFKIIIKMLLIFHKWVSTKMLRFSATKSFARALVFANNTNNRIEFVFIQNEIIIIIYYMCMKSRLLYSCFFVHFYVVVVVEFIRVDKLATIASDEKGQPDNAKNEIETK